MPTQLVLITGATGHLGYRTLVEALRSGYHARIALRRLEQADKIKQTASVRPYLDKVEFVQVPDITAPDAYHEAIKGVDFVLHIASPLPSSLDPKEKDWPKLLYVPAENGTLRMLSAAAKESGVKRVVITSSVVVTELKDAYDLTALPDEQTRNNLQESMAAYGVSKILAHTTGTKFMEENKVSFDLVRILPGYTQGANELYSNAEEMRDPTKNGSNEGTIRTALGLKVGQPRIAQQAFLDDVAKAHVLALGLESVKNGDNLLVAANGGTSVPWSDYVPVIKKLFPEAVASEKIAPGMEDDTFLANYDVSSSEEALGFKFAGTEEIVKSVVGQYLELLQ